VNFYVYIIFRLDGSPLYVGKGRGERWRRFDWSSRRNPHFLRIVAQAKSFGRELPKLKIRDGLTESAAFEIERAFIAAIGREAHGGPLVNLTDGGEGRSGAILSAESRAKIAAAHRGRKLSPEHRAAIGAGVKGKKKLDGHGAKIATINRQRVFAPETRAKISAANKGRKLPKRGPLSIEARENLRRKNTGKTATAATRAKMSATHKVRWAERLEMVQ
jgi:NUMOD3 motif